MNIDVQQVWQDVVDTVRDQAPSILMGVAILVVGFLVARSIRGLVRRILRRGNLDDTLAGFLSTIAYILLLTFVIIAALGKLGIETTSLIAVLAAAGLAIGLALQDSLSNFASGVLLIGFGTFKSGDFVEAAGIDGIVEEVSVFFTRLRTPDNKSIVVPNSEITSGAIINYSARDTRRIDMVVGVGYDDDLRTARRVLEETVRAHDKVLDQPEITIAVHELGDSSVNFVVRPWVKTEDYWPVRWDLTEQIKLALDDAGVSIPYPHREVYVHQPEEPAQS